LNNKLFINKSFIGCLYELDGKDHEELIFEILKEGEDVWEIKWRLDNIIFKLNKSLGCNDEQ